MLMFHLLCPMVLLGLCFQTRQPGLWLVLELLDVLVLPLFALSQFVMTGIGMNQCGALFLSLWLVIVLVVLSPGGLSPGGDVSFVCFLEYVLLFPLIRGPGVIIKKQTFVPQNEPVFFA